MFVDSRHKIKKFIASWPGACLQRLLDLDCLHLVKVDLCVTTGTGGMTWPVHHPLYSSPSPL